MKRLILAISCLVMLSCYRDNGHASVMDISKYKGYVIVKQVTSEYKYFDTYVLKKGDTIRKEQMPSIFSDVYKVGDTIN